MYTCLKYAFLILFSLFTTNIFACHKGDFESSGKGHHKFGKNIGIFQFTENSTISVSTSTSCDFYLAFLDSEYDLIKQQVAYGLGAHLDALASINGCEENVKADFSQALRYNYIELFSDHNNPQALSNGIEQMIDSNAKLKLYCEKV